MINLCHFAIVVAGVTIPADVSRPLIFSPILGEGYYKDIPMLLGYEPPTNLPEGILAGTQVIVPRFAAAVGWALKCGLEPFCVPLSGERQKDGTFVCSELEPAPEQLAVPFDKKRFFRLFSMDRIQRALPSPLPVLVLNGPDLPPVPVEEQAIRRKDGTVQVPALKEGMTAILVPQDGLIIEACERLGVAVLVTDVPGERTRLLQVR